MERTVGYFEQYGLFQEQGRRPQRPDTTTALKSVQANVEDWYTGFWDIAMKYSEGDIQAAEHFMDTGVFMFYYRMRQKSAYIQWHNEQMKEQAKG